MNRSLLPVALIALAALGACAEDDPTAPPEIVYDSSVCDFCNMIISDSRFAAATIVEDEAGRPAPRLFDDYNCQINDEAEAPDRVVLTRWVHDHDSREWIRADEAHFVIADELRTPMASHAAAFADRAAADRAASQFNGEVADLDALRAHFNAPSTATEETTP